MRWAGVRESRQMKWRAEVRPLGSPCFQFGEGSFSPVMAAGAVRGTGSGARGAMACCWLYSEGGGKQGWMGGRTGLRKGPCSV